MSHFRVIYAHGYFPFSSYVCQAVAIARNLIGDTLNYILIVFLMFIAYVDFSTLAATSACIAWNIYQPNRKISRRRWVKWGRIRSIKSALLVLTFKQFDSIQYVNNLIFIKMIFLVLNFNQLNVNNIWCFIWPCVVSEWCWS